MPRAKSNGKHPRGKKVEVTKKDVNPEQVFHTTADHPELADPATVADYVHILLHRMDALESKVKGLEDR